MEKILKLLTDLAEPEYKNFHQKLMPTVDKSKVLGVRMPKLKKLAKDILSFKTEITSNEVKLFLAELPHQYYEENNLHMLLLSEEKHDLCVLLKQVEIFLPYIDNWATCDSFSPKLFAKNKEIIYQKCFEWLTSENIYTVRFAIVTLMRMCARENFDQKAFDSILSIKSSEYYIKIAIAWYICEVSIYHFDIVKSIWEEGKIDKWIHNASIKKAVESYRLNEEQKIYLKTLKIR